MKTKTVLFWVEILMIIITSLVADLLFKDVPFTIGNFGLFIVLYVSIYFLPLVRQLEKEAGDE